MRKRLFALIVGALLVAGPTSAWALAYTLSGPVAFNTNGVSGTINPVTDLTGTSICLVGTCSTSIAQDWFLFTVTLNGGSDPVDQIGVAVSGVTSLVGVGYYSGPGETPTSGTLATASLGLVNYSWPNVNALNLNAGETSDRLFGTWTLGTLPGPGIPPPVPAGTVSFMIGEAGSTNFSAGGGVMVLVPEPGSILLLGGGLLGLGLAGRRRRA